MKLTYTPLKNFTWQKENLILVVKDGDEDFKHLPEALKEAFTPYLNRKLLKADESKLLHFSLNFDGKMRHVYLMKLKSGPHARVRRAAMRSVEARLKADKVNEAQMILASPFCEKGTKSLLKNLYVADARFDRYLGHGGPMPNEKNELPQDTDKKELTLDVSFVNEFDAVEAILKEAKDVAEAINLTRRLVNEPANAMTPEMLAEEAKAMSEAHGIECEIKGVEEILELGMEAYWAVAKGSDNEPRFIVMRYLNNPESEEKIALVGKGICYDSGGYAIKPATGMVTMHADMGGAAAVIGAMAALAKERAKVNAVGIIAACENMISGRANKNGDIIGSMAGKTIEVINTDAEGRLTLADAVTFAQRHEKATRIIDIATLTGACVVALGDEFAGVISNDEEIFAALEEASDYSGDKIWRMPNDDEMAMLNKSERADIVNAGARGGGMITAGLFVRAFTGGLPWAHIDIAGPAWQAKPSEQYGLGASGFGAELLYLMTKKLF